MIGTYVLGEGLAGCTGSVDHVILGKLLFIQLSGSQLTVNSRVLLFSKLLVTSAQYRRAAGL